MTAPLVPPPIVFHDRTWTSDELSAIARSWRDHISAELAGPTGL